MYLLCSLLRIVCIVYMVLLYKQIGKNYSKDQKKIHIYQLPMPTTCLLPTTLGLKNRLFFEVCSSAHSYLFCLPKFSGSGTTHQCVHPWYEGSLIRKQSKCRQGNSNKKVRNKVLSHRAILHCSCLQQADYLSLNPLCKTKCLTSRQQLIIRYEIHLS